MATKADLIQDVAKKAHIPESTAGAAVDVILNHMTRSLAQGQRVEIRGFGSFACKAYRARDGRNPKTGAKVFVAAKKLPHFKIGKEFKARMDAVCAKTDQTTG